MYVCVGYGGHRTRKTPYSSPNSCLYVSMSSMLICMYVFDANMYVCVRFLYVCMCSMWRSSERSTGSCALVLSLKFYFGGGGSMVSISSTDEFKKRKTKHHKKKNPNSLWVGERWCADIRKVFSACDMSSMFDMTHDSLPRVGSWSFWSNNS